MPSQERVSVQSPHKKNNFDGLRLLGASLVLISHQFALSARTEPSIVGSITFGRFGLMLFFCISGYLVAKSWIRDPSLERFSARRLLRIWPALAAFVIASSIVTGAATGDYATAIRMLANLAPWRILDSRAFPNNPIPFTNGSLWSIPLEIACYAAFAAVAIVAKGALRYVLLALTILSVVYGWKFGIAVQMGRIPLGLPYLPLLACFFFVSAALATYHPSKAATIIAFAAALSACVLHNTTLALILALPVATVFIGNQSWPAVRDAGRYGDFSYGLYLWAWPMQQVIVLTLGAGTNVLVLLAASAASALSLAVASWHLVESPSLRLKPGTGRSRKPRTPAGPQPTGQKADTPATP